MRRNPRHDGMTIAELLLVVAIMGVLAVITIPNFNAFLRSYRASTAVNQMVTMLNLGRQRAVTERELHTFLSFADPQNRWELWRAGDTDPLFQGELPEGTTITQASTFPFDTNGACTSPTTYTGTAPTGQFIRVDGTITSNRTDRFTLEVSPVGRVKTTQEAVTP